jgi:hypothetical protein
VDGIVREYGSKKPLAGVRVRIVQVGGGSPTAPVGFETLGVDTTDAEGKYHFELTLDKQPDAIYLNVPQGYSPYDTERGGIVKGEQHNVVHDLDPYAYTDVHIKNINPFNEDDKMDGYIGGSAVGGLGRNWDRRGIIQLLGNRYNYIDYVVIRNNTRKVFKDSIYISARDTAKYNLHY